MSKILTLAAVMALAIAAQSTAFARSGGASSVAPGHEFRTYDSVRGYPGASGYTPRQLYLHHRCKSTHGVSGCAPGHRFR